MQGNFSVCSKNGQPIPAIDFLVERHTAFLQGAKKHFEGKYPKVGETTPQVTTPNGDFGFMTTAASIAKANQEHVYAQGTSIALAPNNKNYWLQTSYFERAPEFHNGATQHTFRQYTINPQTCETTLIPSSVQFQILNVSPYNK